MASKENKAVHDDRHSFWYYLYKSHLYTSKAEALFKASILSISWVGGFWSDSWVGEFWGNISATAYYLFSIAIIMEYAVQLIIAEKFVPKILPLVLIICNIIVALTSTGQLFNHATETFLFQYIIEIVTMVIIWIDAIIILMIEKPKECQIEDSLSRCGISHNNQQ